MFSILRSLWIWFASASLVLLWVPLVGVAFLLDRDPMRTRTARQFRRLGRAISQVNPWRLHISGGENIDPHQVYVVVSNHQSLADIPLITHLRIDAKWLAKAELFKFPMVGWMLRMSGDIPVDRADRRKAAKALLQCARYLRKRRSVIFFPEGTRSHDGEVLPFNEGPFQLALREQVPVLPLAVEGSGAALPRTSWIFGPSQDIYLEILPPVSTIGGTVKESADLRDRVRESIAAKVLALRARAKRTGREGASPNDRETHSPIAP